MWCVYHDNHSDKLPTTVKPIKNPEMPAAYKKPNKKWPKLSFNPAEPIITPIVGPLMLLLITHG